MRVFPAVPLYAIVLVPPHDAVAAPFLYRTQARPTTTFQEFVAPDVVVTTAEDTDV